MYHDSRKESRKDIEIVSVIAIQKDPNAHLNAACFMATANLGEKKTP